MKCLISLVAGMIALAACQPDKMTGPALEAASMEARRIEPAVMNADFGILSAALDDAAARLAPALEDEAASVKVGAQIERLWRALAAGNTAHARQALSDARDALGSAGETPNGAAIGLALDRTAVLLSSSENFRPVRPGTSRDERS